MTDRELDIMVAEKVMGWIAAPNCWPGRRWLVPGAHPISNCPTDDDIPHFSTGMNEAMKVVAKMRTGLFSARRRFLSELQKAASDGVLDSGSLIAWPDVFWYVKPRVICVAALRSVEESPTNA